MKCPFCEHDDTKVIDSRTSDEGDAVRRRRECVICNERFTTLEAAHLRLPYVVKSTGIREAYQEEKLIRSLERALEKRAVSSQQLSQIIHRIKHKLFTLGEREIFAREIGDMVMSELKEIDEVAYVRFASVYRAFKDINEFNDEITRLKNESNNR